MRQVLVVLVLVLTVVEIGQAVQERGWWTYGAGLGSCGEWSAEHPNQRISVTMRNAYLQQWVLGFVSGFSRTFPEPPRQTDANAIMAWITQYCVAHPLDTVSTASRELTEELSKR